MRKYRLGLSYELLKLESQADLERTVKPSTSNTSRPTITNDDGPPEKDVSGPPSAASNLCLSAELLALEQSKASLLLKVVSSYSETKCHTHQKFNGEVPASVKLGQTSLITGNRVEKRLQASCATSPNVSALEHKLGAADNELQRRAREERDKREKQAEQDKLEKERLEAERRRREEERQEEERRRKDEERRREIVRAAKAEADAAAAAEAELERAAEEARSAEEESSRMLNRRGSGEIDMDARLKALLDGVQAGAAGDATDILEGLGCIRFYFKAKYGRTVVDLRESKDERIRRDRNEIARKVARCVNRLSANSESFYGVWSDLDGLFTKLSTHLATDSSAAVVFDNELNGVLVESGISPLTQTRPLGLWLLYFGLRFYDALLNSVVAQCIKQPTLIWIFAFLLKQSLQKWHPLYMQLFKGAVFFNSVLSIPFFPSPAKNVKAEEHCVAMGMRVDENEERFYVRAGVLTRVFVATLATFEDATMIKNYMSRLIQRIKLKPKRSAPFVLCPALEVGSYALFKADPQITVQIFEVVESMMPSLHELAKRSMKSNVSLEVPLSQIDTLIQNYRMRGVMDKPAGYQLKKKEQEILDI